MADFTPTAEQLGAIDLFRNGADSIAIEARAGTGKTSTLRLLAQEEPGTRIQYVAFNKAIVVDATGNMPGNVMCNTAHSLAFRAIGRQYQHRLNASRAPNHVVARALKLDPIGLEGGKVLRTDYLAGLVMRSITQFCHTTDRVPNVQHVPYIEGIDRGDTNNNAEVARELLPALDAAWQDLSSTDGVLRFQHDHYLKLWQLSAWSNIGADVILFDEAQDANPVMADVVARQQAHKVYVGDSEQAIYEFTGAVDTLKSIDADNRAFLTLSFRFGPRIADVANQMLRRLNAIPFVIGNPDLTSYVGPVDRPDAILTRTNVEAVHQMLLLQRGEQHPHLVGGGSDVVTFAKAARDLMNGRTSWHPELACFDTWREVMEYVEEDQQGADLKLMTGLVNDFGVETILEALDNMPTEGNADVIVSTAHKSKGREWDRVKLAGDFFTRDAPPEELRLLYVAATRAKRELDISACDALQP